MVASVPDSIRKLQFLKVFDMRSASSGTTLLPKGIRMMYHLRHRNAHRRMQFSDLAGGIQLQVDALRNLQVLCSDLCIHEKSELQQRKAFTVDASSSSSSSNPHDTPCLDDSSSSSSNPRDKYDVFLSFTSRGDTRRTFKTKMSQQMKAVTYIGVALILYILYKHISDGTRCRDPRRTERSPSLDDASSSSSNPEDTPSPDASSSSSTNPQDTPCLDASSSSSSNPRDNYDVFLSFTIRGGRWRTFTSHLHRALEQNGIYTFLDVKKIERGEDISPGLDNGIKSSRCAVVVLSEEYTSSHWCMDEFVQILKCRNDSNINQIVLPIFYHVSPYDIEKGFQSLEKKFRDDKERVKSWRDALIQLPGIAGHHVDNTCTDEAIFIKDFIKVVSSRLFDPALLNISKDLVGMISRLEKLKQCVSRCRSSFGDVRFIGICGFGGLGKTTLATAYLKYMSCQFQAISFLANIREVCVKEHDGLVRLQKQLLTDILKGEHKINNVSEGKGLISRRLCRKKILVVLDDVDQLKQLEGLAGESNWFGEGSQIIVTTRDESLLPRMYGKKEYIIHKVGELEDSEALRLFSLKAFKSDCPLEDYRELSVKVIEYASGLPLALVVLGSFLRGKTIDEWNSALDSLNQYPENEIMRVLRISFDGLRETEKNIFLDIACFFNGSSIDYVTNIMDICGFFPEIGIRSLVDKSLLRMDHDGNRLRMHDLLEELGKEIVREESRKEPGRRSRIWLKDDFNNVLINETGTEEVEAIVCPDMNLKKISTLGSFSNMKKVRLLDISSWVFWKDRCLEIEYLPNELRFLKWVGFPLKCFPRSFQPRGLVELCLGGFNSRIERLWDNPMMEPLYNLKCIDLRCSQGIIKLENFSLFPNLERLILRSCFNLEEIDLSNSDLKRLTSLSLSGCRRLKNLPTSMGGLESLKFLDLSSCSSLGNLPEDLESLNNLEELDATGTGLRDTTPSVEDQKALHGWKNIWNTIAGNGLSSAGLSCLEILNLNNCGIRDGEFPDDFRCLVSLEYLDLHGNKFSYLPAHFNQLSKLRHLNLSRCQDLTSLGPELPDSLEGIYCMDCFKLVKRQGSKRTAITSLGRYLQNPPKPSKIFEIVLPGNGIPSWFTQRVIGSSSISLPLYPNWCTNNWMGFALCVCFTTKEYLRWRDLFWEIKINQEDWGFGHVHMAAGEYMAEKEYNNHIWLLYLPRDTYFHSEWHKKIGHIQFSFKCPWKEMIVEIKQCGAHLVYEQYIEKLSQTAKDEPIELPDEDEGE